MNRTLLKISNKLRTHDSIIMACSTYACKEILTLEKGYVVYWVRRYRGGTLIEQQDYWRRYSDAREAFYRYKRNFSEFKYNNYDGGPKHYVHE